MLQGNKNTVVRGSHFLAMLVIIFLLFLLLYFYNPGDDSFQYMVEMRNSQEQAIRAIEQGDMVRAHDILNKSISKSYQRERSVKEKK